MKKFIAVLLLCTMLIPVFVGTNVAYAEEEKAFVTVTDSRVYLDDGSIYFATKIEFDPTKTYTFTQDGEIHKLTYLEIVPVLHEMYNSKNITSIFDEKAPNVLIRVDRKFSSRTEMNNVLGITGDEVYPPMEQNKQFFFTDYISRLDSYLAGGGKKVLEVLYLQYAKSLFGISNPTIDFSQIEYRYCYGTDLKSITSNANKVVEDKAMYYHIFTNLTEDSEIVLTQRIPNATNWQVIVLVLSVLIVLIGVVVVVTKRRKNGN